MQEDVSMPHAALWVVQQRSASALKTTLSGFNAARGFVGGAAKGEMIMIINWVSFNAARSIVCGAT